MNGACDYGRDDTTMRQQALRCVLQYRCWYGLANLNA